MSEVVVVSDPSQGRWVQRVEAGAHSFVADERKPTGDDLGPDPYTLLLASLGTCTAMTLQMYASHKQWPLESVTVRLRYERTHVQDCESDDEPRRLHRIDRALELGGSLTDEQRERLVQVAERCPVHRTLTEEKEIRTTLTRT